MNCAGAPVMGGCGRKCRKPLRPNTTKTRPKRMRAAWMALVFKGNLLASPSDAASQREVAAARQAQAREQARGRLAGGCGVATSNERGARRSRLGFPSARAAAY